MTNTNDIKILIQTIALCKYVGVTPRTMQALLVHYESMDRIFNADAGGLMTISSMEAELANRIANVSEYMPDAQSFYDILKSQDIHMVSRFEESYPDSLFELNDPPSFIYYRGKLPHPDQKIAAIVGTSKPSNEGLALTAALAKRFSDAQVQLISGLNSGIAAASHLSARTSGGISFAVLAVGISKIETKEERALAIDIVQQGGIITEHSPDVERDEVDIKMTNRLIAAMAQAVVVTEFYNDSFEVLDLLECCAEIGKLVFILIEPGHGVLTETEAFNKAVRNGAIPMVGLDKIDDIIKSLV